jgi:hypothetical protein
MAGLRRYFIPMEVVSVFRIGAPFVLPAYTKIQVPIQLGQQVRRRAGKIFTFAAVIPLLKTYLMLPLPVKKAGAIAWVSILTLTLFSCSKRSDHHLPEDDSHGSITFTARGEDVTCTRIYNEAIFHKTFSANYERTDYKVLNIHGKDKDAPVRHESNIVLEMITTGDLAKGAYPIIDEDDLSSYDYGSVNPDPDKRALGIASANDPASSALWGKKDVRSRGGGQLVISVIILNDCHAGEVEGEAGYRKGLISGTFEFTGTNWDKASPGSCKGKFDKVPIKIYDSE